MPSKLKSILYEFNYWTKGQFFAHLLFFSIISCCLFQTPANAQDGQPNLKVNGHISQKLLSLTDEDVRALLLKELQDKERATNNSSSKFNPALLALRITEGADAFAHNAREIFGAYDELPYIFNKGFNAFASDQRPGSGGRFVYSLIISFFAATGITWGFSKFRNKGISKSVDTVSIEAATIKKITFHSKNILSGIIYIAIFLVSAVVVYFLFFDEDPKSRLAFFFYLVPVGLLSLAVILLKAFYSPFSKEARIPTFSDVDAGRLFATMLISIGFGAFAFFTCALIYTLGVTGPVHDLLLVVATSLTALLLTLSFFLNRHAIVSDLEVMVSGSPRRFICTWSLFLTLMPVFIWILLFSMELLGDYVPYGASLFTILVVSIYPHIDATLARGEQNLFEMDVDGFHYALIRTGRLLGVALVLAMLLFAWGLRPLVNGAEGNGITEYWRALVNSMFYVLIGIATWRFSNTYISRQIEKEDRQNSGNGDDLGETEIGGAGLSRTRTILPLARRSIQALVIVSVLIALLSALGIDIAPILAGAGVLGLAIGFGSQTLVRDIVSGAFFLIDDAVRIGEYIDTGSVKGVVEKMTVRSLQLRHHRGAVHTIPFGEIKTLSNYSRDWAIMKLRFTVPFDTDLEKVRKLLKKAGRQLAENEEIKDDFIQPFKAQGAIQATDHGFVISTKFMSKPGKQFFIRRHAFNTVQRVFEENGIEFARPTINVSTDGLLTNKEEVTTKAAVLAAHQTTSS